MALVLLFWSPLASRPRIVASTLSCALLLGFAGSPSFGQSGVADEAANDDDAKESDDDQGGPESVTIEPYTGAPIFLPEAEAPPAPTEVESRSVSEKYPESNKVRFEREVVKFSDNSLRSNGPAKEYYQNGNLYTEGQFNVGYATGEWTYYHPNGKVAKKVTYAEGLPDGEVRLFTPEETLVAVRNYEAGKRTGVWVVYGEDGKQPLREETYADGLANGPWKVYYSNGQLRQESAFKGGKLEGIATEYSQDGDKRAEASFKEGLRDGKTTIWQRDGKIVERMFTAGRMTGDEKKGS
ncbi:MAG: toxin-antitoxin system YwqK family antitoxin [Lacipirellulaceae bacterium]